MPSITRRRGILGKRGEKAGALWKLLCGEAPPLLAPSCKKPWLRLSRGCSSMRCRQIAELHGIAVAVPWCHEVVACSSAYSTQAVVAWQSAAATICQAAPNFTV